MTTPIKVLFSANRSVMWSGRSDDTSVSICNPPSEFSPPGIAAEPGQQTPSQLPTTVAELKERFIAFLEERLHRLNGVPVNSGSDEPEADRAYDKKSVLSVLVLARDPTSTIASLELDLLDSYLRRKFTISDYFYSVYATCAKILLQFSPWGTWKSKSSGENKTAPKSGRPAADTAAQRAVPSWYGRCIVTGPCGPVHGAHILPVGAKETDLNDLWRSLRLMWPIPDVESLSAEGREKTNILPLAPTVHAMFDRFAFGLRPITHPDDPDHQTKIYLQVVFLKDLEQRGSLEQTPWRFDRDGGFADLARGTEGGMSHLVQHGDVYEISTTDKDAYPLPDFHFLEIQYAVHKIMAGISGAGALQYLFGGEPPSDEGPTEYDVEIPSAWAWLLEAAVEAKVLTEKAAECWANAFIRHQVNRLLFREVSLPLRPTIPVPTEEPA